MKELLDSLKIPLDKLKRWPVIILILTNMVPLFGVIFIGWQSFQVVFLFWTENVVIGLFNVIKMAISQTDPGGWARKRKFIPFFCVHYGMFALIHGMLVFSLFGGLLEYDELSQGINNTYYSISNLSFGIGVLALFISHAVSFIINYINKREYKSLTLEQLMIQPYSRVTVLHITILIGGFLVMLFGSPIAGLVMLIIVKTYVDIKSHLKQHNIFDAASMAQQGQA